MDTWLSYGREFYAFYYFGLVIAVTLLEWALPRRQPGDTLRLRWFGNFALSILGIIAVRSLFPLLGVAWAIFCREHGWGLFNRISLPGWVAVVLTLIALDVAIYAQHYLLHRVPLLWRLHRTHHSDQDYDFTTGLRFHPLETIYTTAVLFAVILVLGAPPIGVLISQLLMFLITLVEHANVRVLTRMDSVLRLVVVTPDMHRIHHSVDARECQSNFGSIFPWWDRLFGTYVDQPAAGQNGISFGLAEFRERKHLTLPWMLVQPFLRTRDSRDAAR